MNHDSHVHSRSIQTDSISYVSSRLQQRQWLYGSMPAKHVNILRLEWMIDSLSSASRLKTKTEKKKKKLQLPFCKFIVWRSSTDYFKNALNKVV